MTGKEAVDIVWHDNMAILRHLALTDLTNAGSSETTSAQALITGEGKSRPAIASEGFTSEGVIFRAIYFEPVSSVEEARHSHIEGTRFGEPLTALDNSDGQPKSPVAVFPPIGWGEYQVVQTMWPATLATIQNVTGLLTYSLADGNLVSPLHTARMGSDAWLSTYAVFRCRAHLLVTVGTL